MNEAWWIGMLITSGLVLNKEALEATRGWSGLAIFVIGSVVLFCAWPVILGIQIRYLLERKR